MYGKVLTSAIMFPIVCFVSFFVTYQIINSNTQISSDVIESALDTDPNRSLPEQVFNNSIFTLKDELNIFTDPDIPKTAKRYVIVENSKAGYIANKKLFLSNIEETTGETNVVVGGGWIDQDSQKVSLKARIDLSPLKSIEPERDADIKNLFISNLAFVVIDKLEDPNYQINIGKKFETNFLGKVTINNITNPAVFNASGIITKDTFSIKGTANVKLTDYKIEPPKSSNLFEVEDTIKLYFDIYGAAFNQN